MLIENVILITGNTIFFENILSGKHSSSAIRFIVGIIKILCVTSIPEKHAPGEEKEKSGQRMLEGIEKEARSTEKGVIKFIRSTLTGEH